ncbi:MAG TPA: hypothetical protein VNZ49_09360 [Bacteroidia bacterium]|jgi:hypothetical protein|nr:hypothetical protein [Bacteroidia bacterium]
MKNLFFITLLTGKQEVKALNTVDTLYKPVCVADNLYVVGHQTKTSLPKYKIGF